MSLQVSGPSVLVGITTRNRKSILPKAIDSALTQKGVEITVSVFDDGSDDDTSALRHRYPSVRWETRKTSQGLIKSRNHLMSTAGTKYYISLDDDAWFLRDDEIAVAVSRLELDERLAAVAFDILSPDHPSPAERLTPRAGLAFIGCGHALRLSAAHEAGYYAETPGTYGSEERDLALRLADLGYRIEFLPGVHVWHDKAWNGRDWAPLHRSGVCNDLVMTLRRCPLPDLLFVLPLKTLRYLGFWMGHPSHFKAGLAGFRDCMKNWKYIWSSRRPVRRETYWQHVRGIRSD